MKIKRKLKNLFSLYNLAIIGCTILVVVALFFILKPTDTTITTSDGIEIIQSTIKEDEEISEKQARKMAVKQLEILNEKAKEDEIKMIKIQRNGEEYYYISTPSNTLEIKIKSGQITRINSVPIKY